MSPERSPKRPEESAQTPPSTSEEYPLASGSPLESPAGTPPPEDSGPPPSPPEEYPLSGMSPLEPPAETPPPEHSGPPPSPREIFQFSLAELFVMAMALAFLLGLLRLLPRTLAAFAAGMTALVGLGLLHMLKIDRPIVQVGWWALLVIYLLTAIAVLMSE